MPKHGSREGVSMKFSLKKMKNYCQEIEFFEFSSFRYNQFNSSFQLMLSKKKSLYD